MDGSPSYIRSWFYSIKGETTKWHQPKLTHAQVSHPQSSTLFTKLLAMVRYIIEIYMSKIYVLTNTYQGCTQAVGRWLIPIQNTWWVSPCACIVSVWRSDQLLIPSSSAKLLSQTSPRTAYPIPACCHRLDLIPTRRREHIRLVILSPWNNNHQEWCRNWPIS